MHLRAATCLGLTLVMLLSALPSATAEPLGGGRDPRPKVTKPPLRSRMASSLRRASVRTAGALHKLHQKTPPAVRHGVAAVGLTAITLASMDSMAGSQLMSFKGILSGTGVMLSAAAALQQTTATLRSLFPRQMRKVDDRVRRSPIGPLFPRDQPTTLGGRLRRFLGMSSAPQNDPPRRRRSPQSRNPGD